MNRIIKRFIFFLICSRIIACSLFTDPATRIAYDIERATKRMSRHDDKITLNHKEPSKRGECEGPYKVQFDKVGLIAIWCFDENGKIVSSHTTSYYARFVDTPQTWIVEKKAGEMLVIDMELHGERAVITGVH